MTVTAADDVESFASSVSESPELLVFMARGLKAAC